jgi:3-hydroxyisobutyrate dehydrogenase-like beta-hydroxyacid dehydrogenase
MTTVMLLHPGAMGASIGSVLIQNGHTVLWVPEERSQTTKQRAADAGLEESEFRTGLNRADIIISVTPPGVAVSVAAAVADEGFDGVYVDMNAVAPQSATQMAALFPQFVDGGIVGPPAWERGTTRLGLSGPRTTEVESLFAGSTIETIYLGPEIGKASAFKVGFAAWTKGSGALLLLVCAYARSQGVENELFQEWERRGMGMETQTTTVAQQMGPKSWRFGDEMREISYAMEAAGLGTGLFKHAGATFDRLAHLKNATDQPPTREEVIRDLLEGPPDL